MASKKGLSITIKPDDIIYTSITKSHDSYNSARLVTKVGEKAYMNISVEWEGDTIPSFAMDLMGTLQASELEVGRIVEGKEDEYAEYLARDVEDAAENCKGCGTTIYGREGKDATTCPGCGNLVEPKKTK